MRSKITVNIRVVEHTFTPRVLHYEEAANVDHDGVGKHDLNHFVDQGSYAVHCGVIEL